MAKTRVYELARDLNLENKILLSKLNDLDIAVKSHMSALDDDTVAQIRQQLFGKKEETIEETRVKPTVIRRRKKVKVEAAPEPEVPEAAEAPSEKVPEEAEPVEEIAAAEPEPEVPEAVEEEAAPAEPAEETVAEVEAEPVAELVEEKPLKKVVKRVKQEESAKIIQLPVKPVERPKTEKPAKKEKAKTKSEPRPGGKPAAPKPGARPGETPAKDAKKKKWKKKGDEGDHDRKFLKKKISFRKKSVVEGQDLYDSGYRSRKPRKGAKAKVPASAQKTQITTAKAIKRRIKIDEAIVLSELAKRMGIKANEMIRTLMGMGFMATVNQSIDYDTAALVAAEFNYEVERAGAAFEEEEILKQIADDPEKLQERPPVVTIMGHVDHGKTSLLDVIRKTRITDLEAGGITQHIGAYHVATNKGQVAFLDTPGHEAFTAMRARGAQVTDIVVLVVAADDGVMPQTLEAINHARAAEVPIIVAVNKIDKANADPDRVKRELAENGLTPEDWGGDTIFLHVSAKEKEGIDELLEMISLQAEILELKANAEKPAIGHVVEAKIDSGRGPVATVLVREGTLRNGEPVVCGIHYGKIRAMLNDRGIQVDSAGPSIPVEVLGLSGVPMAGDELIALEDEKSAKQVSLHRGQKQRSKELAQTNRLSLDNLFEQMQQGEIKDLNIIIKADVHGSNEALVEALTKLSNEEVKVKVVHSATGTVTEHDISLATVSNAIIIGFNVRPTPKVQALASEENVDMRFYNIIYDVIKDVKDALVGLMESTYKEHIMGSAEVREVFQIPKVGAIAGSYVTDGKFERGKSIRVVRDGVQLYDGKNSSLRRFKDDVKEVQSGYECGIGVENFNDIKVGDVLECYYLEEIRPEIE
ncbi:translation initiation factor IF-2 [Alkalispirochaeta odontotermitis]|nr:translation initiation factor IF-2 [Alkalispirochaeta odontotermitis]CAB1083546.1 Translation initiation factor 2 [Olavius algarvensis Delta 1 endosymbiont]